MTNRRRVQSINPKDPMALQKVIEALEVSEGVRGAPGDRKPTVSEVQQMIASGGVVPTAGTTTGGGTTGGGQPGSQIIARPVSGVVVIVIPDGVALGWTSPSYIGHGKTEIWRSPTANLPDAVMIGTSGGNSFVDYQAGNGQTWTYFFRNVVDVSLGATTSPFSAGFEVTSAPVNQILNAANAYTDGRETQIRSDMATADSATLNDANSYTDSQIAALTIIPDAPSDGKMYVRQNGAWVELPA